MTQEVSGILDCFPTSPICTTPNHPPTCRGQGVFEKESNFPSMKLEKRKGFQFQIPNVQLGETEIKREAS